jgi:hypothetical protein
LLEQLQLPISRVAGDVESLIGTWRLLMGWPAAFTEPTGRL